MLKGITKKISIGIISIAAVVLLASAGDRFFNLSRQIDMFGGLYKSINALYVDDVEPSKLMRTFIDAMLKELDPYTVYYSGSQIETSRIEGSEKLTGIGINFSIIEKTPTITELIKDLSADKAGLKIGDKILEIDGVSVKDKSYEDIGKALKGQVDTDIKLKVLQISGNKKEFTVKRMEFHETNVPFYGMLTKEIGFINLKIFNPDAGKDVREAFEDLKKKNPGMTGLILDLRGNPGGLLNESVNIVNLFIDKNKLVVNTKGKMKEWNSTFNTKNDAIDTKIPIAVITNSKSASASEIVSGALQDYDRAVIIGNKTYGKGLVQMTHNLSYGTGFKVTVAKYYIPSGRCIQAVNYAERNTDGSVKKIPDSLKREFETANGRKVYDGGGVDPDLPLEEKSTSTLVSELQKQYLIFDYATKYYLRHNSIDSADKFKLTDADYQDFVSFIKTRKFTYKSETEKTLEKIKDAATEEKYFDAIQKNYANALKEIENNNDAELLNKKAEIKSLLESEICNRYFYSRGKIEKSLQTDSWISKSIEVLNNPKLYNGFLVAKGK
jgi:carboxyl-terminal processing protease